MAHAVVYTSLPNTQISSLFQKALQYAKCGIDLRASRVRADPASSKASGRAFTHHLQSDSTRKFSPKKSVTRHFKNPFGRHSLIFQQSLPNAARVGGRTETSNSGSPEKAEQIEVSEMEKLELSDKEKPSMARPVGEVELQELLQNKRSSITFAGPKDLKSKNGRKFVLSGSFNPLHDGHVALMEAACSAALDSFPVFEISIINADKPPLEIADVIKRVKQFEKLGCSVVVTNQPYFFRKAEILKDSTFVIGHDTAIRLLNPKYYGGSRENMIRELRGIQKNGVDFIVAGRVSNGVFHTFEEVEIPGEISDLFRGIPEEKFRMDISSTEIRAKMAKDTGESS